MIIIRNNIIPFKGFKAINLFGILFVRKNAKLDWVTMIHEEIHTKQMVEMLFIFYYLWYLLEALFRLVVYKDRNYHNISFEREAFLNDENEWYPSRRKHYAWFKYLYK